MVVSEESSRPGLLLNDLHGKANQAELGLLKEGVDEGQPEFDLGLSRDEGS